MRRLHSICAVVFSLISSQSFGGSVALTSKVKNTFNGKVKTYYSPVTYNAKTNVFTGTLAMQIIESAPITLKPKTRCFLVKPRGTVPMYPVSTKTPRVCLAKNGVGAVTIITAGPQMADVDIEEESATSPGTALTARVHFYLAGMKSFGIGLPTDVLYSGGVVLKQDTCMQLIGVGGIPPYRYTVLPPEMGHISPENEICTGKKSGVFSVTGTDDTPRKPLTSMQYFNVREPFAQTSPDPKFWQKIYWKDAKGNRLPISNPSVHPNGGVYFDFPDIAVGIAGYFTNLVGYVYLKGKSLRARFAIETEGPVEFDHKTEPFNTSDFPAHVRFYFQDAGGISPNELGRWWSNQKAVKLEQGEFELEVPLTPNQWSSVYGKSGDFSEETKKRFYRTIETPAEIGFTFGGGSFYGHGVRTKNGKARFILRSLDVVPTE